MLPLKKLSLLSWGIFFRMGGANLCRPAQGWRKLAPGWLARPPARAIIVIMKTTFKSFFFKKNFCEILVAVVAAFTVAGLTAELVNNQVNCQKKNVNLVFLFSFFPPFLQCARPAWTGSAVMAGPKKKFWKNYESYFWWAFFRRPWGICSFFSPFLRILFKQCFFNMVKSTINSGTVDRSEQGQ